MAWYPLIWALGGGPKGVILGVWRGLEVWGSLRSGVGRPDLRVSVLAVSNKLPIWDPPQDEGQETPIWGPPFGGADTLHGIPSSPNTPLWRQAIGGGLEGTLPEGSDEGSILRV